MILKANMFCRPRVDLQKLQPEPLTFELICSSYVSGICVLSVRFFGQGPRLKDITYTPLSHTAQFQAVAGMPEDA